MVVELLNNRITVFLFLFFATICSKFTGIGKINRKDICIVCPGNEKKLYQMWWDVPFITGSNCVSIGQARQMGVAWHCLPTWHCCHKQWLWMWVCLTLRTDKAEPSASLRLPLRLCAWQRVLYDERTPNENNSPSQVSCAKHVCGLGGQNTCVRVGVGVWESESKEGKQSSVIICKGELRCLINQAAFVKGYVAHLRECIRS